VVQVKPHDVPSQVGVPLAGAVHGVVHEAPQVATAVFSTQALPHG
jgi:hypothetical protein